MAVTTQTVPVIAASGKETELTWFVTEDPAEFHSRPARCGEVRVLDQSKLINARRERRAAFTAAQIKAQTGR